MATKTTRVTAVIAAQVEGSKEITQLAKQLDQLPDQQDVAIGAEVTGTKELDGLAETIDRLPSSTSTSIDARVTGDQELAGLATDIDSLPSSASSSIKANVSGDQDVAGLTTDIKQLPSTTSTTVKADTTGQAELATLAGDIKQLPASTDTKVEVVTTGDAQLDRMLKQLAEVPADKNVKVSAKVSGGSSQGLKKLKKDLDAVEESAKGAGESVSGFASESTGTLGSQFSGGIGTVADFGEQFRNLKGAFSEAGGGLSAFGKVFGGVAATIGAGLIFDQISGQIEHANALMEESKGIVKDLTGALLDNGNQWDADTQRMLINATVGGETFQTLLDAGANLPDLLDAITKGDGAAFGRVWEQVAKGPKAFDATTIAALAAAKPLVQAKQHTQELAGATLDYEKNAGIAADNTAADTAKISKGWGTAATDISGAITGVSQAIAGQAQGAQIFADIASSAPAAVEAIDSVSSTLGDMAGDAAQFALDTDGVSTALDGVSQAASDAQRDLQFLGAEIDKLAGRDRGAEQAALDLAAGIDSFAEAYTAAKKAKQLDTKALAKWDVAALSATKGGRDLVKSVDEVRTGYDESVASAFEAGAAHGDVAKGMKDARAAADTARKAFIKEATDMGLTGDQAKALADKVGILEGKKLTDKTFKMLGEDKKAKQAIKDLEAKKIADKILKINGDKGPAERTLALLRNAKLADKIQQIKANTSDVKTKIQQLVALGIPPKYAEIIAKASGTAAAEQAIQNVADAEYQATIQVVVSGISGINASVQRFIDIILGTNMLPPTESAGLSAGVTSSATTGGSVSRAPSATVHANHAITVAAPIVVNVTGAIDPASTARQIRQILTRAERRTGPLRATMANNLQAPV